ncbi:PD-(D/E)XK nuclease family protein [Kitasatospora sp. NPDC101176]|uniref:PD-(D/E)XK nuclease family protein n=1 Tax=Kitasatospora sp. NPDC101176 TaxID=3364099 RepID=UPI0038200D81
MAAPNGTPADADRWSAAEAEITRLNTAGLWMPGPTTVLDVLGSDRRERSHQLLIGWLLDPRRPHGLGTAVLAGLLATAGRADLAAADGLHRARVELEVVRARSRADIVVTAPAFKLVIELKVDAAEGPRQTERLADDHAQPQPLVLLFLTLDGDAPADGRFTAVSLRTFARVLRRALADTPRPAHAHRGRETAADLLETLERMTGMAPANQAAARLWLGHGEHLLDARAAARDVLTRLPAAVGTALGGLGLAGPVRVVAPFDYRAEGRTRTGGEPETYPERAVLLTRPAWCTADGRPRAGIGLGSRAKPDPFEKRGQLRPFLGIRATDPAVYDHLDEACEPLVGEAPWDWWPRWEYLDLALPADGEDLVEAYAMRAAVRIADWWERHHALVDRALRAAGPA